MRFDLIVVSVGIVVGNSMALAADRVCEKIGDRPGIYLVYKDKEKTPIELPTTEPLVFEKLARFYVVPNRSADADESVWHVRLQTIAKSRTKQTRDVRLVRNPIVRSECAQSKDGRADDDLDRGVRTVGFKEHDDYIDNRDRSNLSLKRWHFWWGSNSGRSCRYTADHIQKMESPEGVPYVYHKPNVDSARTQTAIAATSSGSNNNNGSGVVSTFTAEVTAALVHSPSAEQTCYSFRLPANTSFFGLVKNWQPTRTQVKIWQLPNRKVLRESFWIRWTD